MILNVPNWCIACRDKFNAKTYGSVCFVNKMLLEENK